MKKPLVDRIPFAKLVTIFAASFGVGLGLCGLDYLLAVSGIGKSTEEFGVGPIDALSLLVMIVSLVGLLTSSVAWALVGMLQSLGFGRGGNETPILDDSKIDKRPESPKPPGHKDE